MALPHPAIDSLHGPREMRGIEQRCRAHSLPESGSKLREPIEVAGKRQGNPAIRIGIRCSELLKPEPRQQAGTDPGGVTIAA